MHDLLEKINEAVKNSKNGALEESEMKISQKRYRTILTKGKKECPLLLFPIKFQDKKEN